MNVYYLYPREAYDRKLKTLRLSAPRYLTFDGKQWRVHTNSSTNTVRKVLPRLAVKMLKARGNVPKSLIHHNW